MRRYFYELRIKSLAIALSIMTRSNSDRH